MMQNVVKKAWSTPTVETLDVENTLSGTAPTFNETVFNTFFGANQPNFGTMPVGGKTKI
jgi:hypothetical protein